MAKPLLRTILQEIGVHIVISATSRGAVASTATTGLFFRSRHEVTHCDLTLANSTAFASAATTLCCTRRLGWVCAPVWEGALLDGIPPSEAVALADSQFTRPNVPSTAQAAPDAGPPRNAKRLSACVQHPPAFRVRSVMLKLAFSSPADAARPRTTPLNEVSTRSGS